MTIIHRLHLSHTFTILLLLLSATPILAHSAPSSPDHPTIQSPERRAVFVQNRIKYIAEIADLTTEEKDVVSKELELYDANKLRLFRQALEIRKRLEAEDLNEDDASRLLELVLKLDEQRTAETTKFFGRLEGKIPAVKMGKVYVGLMGYRHNMGKELRQKMKHK